MKIVRLNKNEVAEIIPEFIGPYTLEGVEGWYGAEFASLCVEATDEVEQRYIYDSNTGLFSEPVAKTIAPTFEERLAAAEQALLGIMGV